MLSSMFYSRCAWTALRTVYTEYPSYLEKAKDSRIVAEQFLRFNLAGKFKTIIAPETIELGPTNTIVDNKLITTSPELREKYLRIKKRTP